MSCIVVGPLIPLKILQRNITKQNYIVENSDPESQTSYTGHAFLSHRSAGLSQRPENPQCCVCHSLIGHPVIIWVVFHDLGSMSLTLNKLLVRYVLEFEPDAEEIREK